MPRGLRYDQLGVTEAMIETWGDTIWAMSNNVQVRRGDPIRLRQFDRVAAERASLGMSDGQIAERTGLARDQVMAIRGLVETRRFQRRSYFELLALGRGRRFHADRHVPLPERPSFGADALALREALRFDPARARAFVEEGAWRNETLAGLLRTRAAAAQGSALLRDGSGTLLIEDALAAAEKVAARLHALGVGRGDVVATRLPGVRAFVLVLVAVARMGAVLLPLVRGDDGRARTLLGIGRARLLVEEGGALASMPCPSIAFESLLEDAPALPEDFVAAAADPLLLVPVEGAGPRLAIHTHQTALAGARAAAKPAGLESILAACVNGAILELPLQSGPGSPDAMPGGAGAPGGWLPAPAGITPA